MHCSTRRFLAAAILGFPITLFAEPLPPAARPASDPSIATALNAVYPALVRIHVVAEQGGSGRMQKNRASGSGTIIHPDGYILTNHHVAGRATKIMVRLADRQEVRATLVGTDALADLAILKLDKSDLRDPDAPLPVAKFGNSDIIRVGDVVLAMGSPAGLSQSVTKGIVANTELIAPGGNGLSLDGETVGELVRWIGHDAVIFPGNSGGPLVNLQGEIIGVNEVGIGSIGGAIPASLARKVADELIEHGFVRRSFTGLLVQPLLKTTKNLHAGILVGGVLPGSPAEKADFKAGDIITACNGRAVAESRAPEDVPVFNRMVLESPIGGELAFQGMRHGNPKSWKVVTEEREPAQPREREILSWGITARDLTKLAAKELHRANNKAALVQSVRPGGPASDAKPSIAADDLILSVGGQPVANVSDLVRISSDITKDRKDPVPTLITYEHDGDSYLTVVKIGPEPDDYKPALARKAWLGISTQVISEDLAKALDIPGAKGVRITRVFPASTAEKAGLRNGDLIVKLDGTVISASRPEESDVFSDTIRQYKIGAQVTLDIRRGSEMKSVKVVLERSPEAAAELLEHHSEFFEFTARDLSRDDRVHKNIEDSTKGVLVTTVKNGGWANLAGLQAEDILLSVDRKPTESVSELKRILATISETKPSHIILLVRRNIITRYLEIEPTW